MLAKIIILIKKVSTIFVFLTAFFFLSGFICKTCKNTLHRQQFKYVTISGLYIVAASFWLRVHVVADHTLGDNGGDADRDADRIS